MRINYRHILVLMVIGAFCLVPLSMSVCVAEENPQFVEAELKHLDYDKVSGTELAKSGGKVSIEIVLCNFSEEIDESTLVFYSELKEDARGSISGDGMEEMVLKSGSSYPLEHKEAGEEIVITWSGYAPEVSKREEDVTLLKITQEIKEEYLVIDIKEDVSSEVIEDAINAINDAGEAIASADEAIANAEEAGVDVSDAETSLALANEHLSNAQQYYGEERNEEALEEAGRAIESAKDAETKAGAAVGGRTYRNYGIIAAVVVIAVVALVLLFLQWKKKRGVY